ncbi:MAG: hypothetical protein OXE84_08330 [Rhodobacteraceae bacterium]|nr:hypothetical protein [Paracoccaceae bacterium]MCY4197551.1 hypothetical protein [Paracoccaceae bacterium]
MKTLNTMLAIPIIASASVADTAGLQIEELFLPHHEARARVAIWYPSTALENRILYADNAVFKGVEAYLEGSVSDGEHPVVLFSHGLGGTDRSQAWLGAALAKKGAIVVLVNHPNSTWSDFDMSDGVKHWTRITDLRAALDALLENPKFSGHVDTTRIMAAGFSYGGWTALSMGGATGNHAGSVETCQRFRQSMSVCDLLLSNEVSLQTIDPDVWNKRYADPRITHVTAIDPGFVWGLDESNLTFLIPQTLVIGLGGANDRLPAADFDRSGLSDLMGGRRIERFNPAYHFTAMPVCKPSGAAILVAENDDPVCTDPAGTDRAAVHSAIIELMSGELGL